MINDRNLARGNIQTRKARELARATLVPGDRIIARRCGGKTSKFTFTGWSPFGNAMGLRVEPAHPINITSINGKRTHYDRLPVTEDEVKAELAIIKARRAAAGPPIRGTATGKPKPVRPKPAEVLDDDLPY